MKIVIVGTAWPYRGGLATFNERLARQFMEDGHEVRIETFSLQYPSFLFPGKTQFTSAPAPADLSIVRSLNSCNPLSWVALGKKLRKKRPDMVICCYWMAFMAPAYGTVCRIARKNGHTRCIALVHNMFPHEKGLLDKFFAPYFVHAQEAFVALSDSVVGDIHTLTSAPAASSPHPIYDHYGERLDKLSACEHLHLDPQHDYLLFFGLVRAYKGLDLLIEALAEVKDALPNVRLLVAGEFYEEEEKYRSAIRQHGLEDRIIVRNEFISDEEVKYYFGAASLIAQPYKSATQSGVTQVAFHFEKPMLVTRVGGLGEIVHHGKMGYAVEVSPHAIAEAVLDYYTHSRQAAFTEYLLQEKTKYHWDKMTQTFLSLYQSI